MPGLPKTTSERTCPGRSRRGEAGHHRPVAVAEHADARVGTQQGEVRHEARQLVGSGPCELLAGRVATDPARGVVAQPRDDRDVPGGAGPLRRPPERPRLDRRGAVADVAQPAAEVLAAAVHPGHQHRHALRRGEVAEHLHHPAAAARVELQDLPARGRPPGVDLVGVPHRGQVARVRRRQRRRPGAPGRRRRGGGGDRDSRREQHQPQGQGDHEGADHPAPGGTHGRGGQAPRPGTTTQGRGGGGHERSRRRGTGAGPSPAASTVTAFPERPPRRPRSRLAAPGRPPPWRPVRRDRPPRARRATAVRAPGPSQPSRRRVHRPRSCAPWPGPTSAAARRRPRPGAGRPGRAR